jgi:hypothetical protein
MRPQRALRNGHLWACLRARRMALMFLISIPRGALGTTRTSTRYRSPTGLRNSARRIAPGVDVRADGGFVIWWPREGYPIEEHPLTEWPNWLLEELTRRRSSSATNSEIVAANRVLNTCLGQRAEGRVASLHEALAKLDPKAWRGDHDGWLELMTACRFVGIAREDFIAWSISDPHYAGDAEVIARKWEST